nr:DUF6518 family protein [Blastococcus saxobsidens]
MANHPSGGVDTAGPVPAHGQGPGLTTAAALGLAVVIGVAWGAATSGLQTVLSGPFSGLANAVGPWVVTAFAVGALCRRPGVAAAAGVLVCFGEVGGYYAVSALRDFGVNPSMVAFWAITGVVGGPLFGLAGWFWRHARSIRWTGASAALMGGVFLTEGAVGYGYYLHHAGNAVLFCVIGALLVAALAARAPAARSAGAPGRALGAAMTWLLVVLPLGAAGQVVLRAVA